MRTIHWLISLCLWSVIAAAEPTVVVLPFDPVIDSVYTFKGGKQSVIDYRNALQQMLITDLGKRIEIRVVELSVVNKYIHDNGLSPRFWNDPGIAAEVAKGLKADYAIIGTYGEFSKEIRVDARVLVAASGDVPPGNSASATATFWEDLPAAASRVAEAIIPIVIASGTLRPTSKAVLFPEGELSAYDPNRTAQTGVARLIVWVNAPAPAITAAPNSDFKRCDQIDLMNIPPERLKGNACRVAVLPAGQVVLRIAHRGYLPYEETLDLAAGKAYRLEVNLEAIQQMPR